MYLNRKGNSIMAIINICPLTGIVNKCTNTSLNISTNYLNHTLGLSVHELVAISDESNLPNLDFPKDSKLVFCALAKQSGLLVHHRQLISISDKIVFTHFNLLKSIAIYLQKEPKFAKRIPKYAHYTDVSMDNFGHFLELIKKEKETYLEERKQLKSQYREQERTLLALDELDVANTKLGMLSSKYAAKLKLTEDTSNGFAMPKQLSQYILVAIQANKDLHEYFTYLMVSPVSKLYNDTEVKEIDLVDVIESIEDWETNLTIKYAVLSFLRKKLTAYNSYEGRKVSKIDISDLDFLLGDIELVESKTVESTARSEAGQTNSVSNSMTNSVPNSVPNSVSNLVSNSVPKQEAELLDALTIAEHKPKVTNSTSTNSTNSTSLAASILAKIAAKKKGN